MGQTFRYSEFKRNLWYLADEDVTGVVQSVYEAFKSTFNGFLSLDLKCKLDLVAASKWLLGLTGCHSRSLWEQLNPTIEDVVSYMTNCPNEDLNKEAARRLVSAPTRICRSRQQRRKFLAWKVIDGCCIGFGTGPSGLEYFHNKLVVASSLQVAPLQTELSERIMRTTLLPLIGGRFPTCVSGIASPLAHNTVPCPVALFREGVNEAVDVLAGRRRQRTNPFRLFWIM
jgi:hypothetical protein